MRAALQRAAKETRGFAYLGGRHIGAPVLLRDPDEIARVELRGDERDGDEVRALLRALDEASENLAPQELCVFLLGYEAAAALDPRAPRHARHPAYGADAWVRIYRDAVHDDAADDERMAGEAPELRLTLPEGARERHVARVGRCLEHIRAGTLQQANLAHPLVVEPTSLEEAARWFLARTAEDEPPFAAFVDDGRGATLVSLSPERFLTWNLREGRAAAYPIKGTRPRGATPDEDERLLQELLESEKDAAEHVMIVDLQKRELERVSTEGGVRVSALMQALSVKNVHHLESEVIASLRPGLRLSELLEATAPGGSITGTPKATSLDVIHALEDGPRGPYTGVLGVVDGRGNGVASVLIRTWIRPDGVPGALHVGGGIVVESDPAAEWQETLDKAAAFGAILG